MSEDKFLPKKDFPPFNDEAKKAVKAEGEFSDDLQRNKVSWDISVEDLELDVFTNLEDAKAFLQYLVDFIRARAFSDKFDTDRDARAEFRGKIMQKYGEGARSFLISKLSNQKLNIVPQALQMLDLYLISDDPRHKMLKDLYSITMPISARYSMEAIGVEDRLEIAEQFDEIALRALQLFVKEEKSE